MTAGYQIAQTAHGVAAFAISKPSEFHQWHEESQYIVALQTEDSGSLELLFERAISRELTPIPFREPDLGDSLTSVAFVPHAENRRFLAGLPLAGRRAGAVNKHSMEVGA